MSGIDFEEHRLEVPAECEGLRLDRFAASTTRASRRRIVEAIEQGNVRVDGRRARKGESVSAGQVVIVRLPRGGAHPIPQPELDLAVVHEDPDFLVVSKPSGAPTHPLEPGELGTLANAIVARYPECAEASDDPREGGVAHRLDTPTSGLVVVARTRDAWRTLREQFGERSVRKEYLALATGEIPGPVEVTVPIGGDPASSGKMEAIAQAHLLRRRNVREAHTIVEVERRFAGWTLARCIITTGVMHQIRVHLAHLGHPVAGDDRYGGESPEGLHRLFLHAAVLGFRHPSSGEALCFEAPLPPELAAVLDSLPKTAR